MDWLFADDYSQFSKAEKHGRLLIAPLALVLIFILFGLGYLVMTALGINPSTGSLIVFALGLPASAYLAHQICSKLAPEMIAEAKREYQKRQSDKEARGA